MKRLFEGILLVDTGDPVEAKAVQSLLADAGYDGLTGATTNPSYFAKNSEIQARMARGEKFTERELLEKYKEVIQELAEIIPAGDITIEVYADKDTPAEVMIAQAREMNSWIDTARIKLPIIEQGMIAAETLKNEVRLNMTLCFSQQQAAAVDSVTKGAKEPVFLSPFIGRLDDSGQNGAQLVGNMVRMFEGAATDLLMLPASFRRVDNILEMVRLKTEVITINYERFKLWADDGFKQPDENFVYQFDGEDIAYEEVELGKPWREYDLQHELTDVGLQKFVDDWNTLLVQPQEA